MVRTLVGTKVSFFEDGFWIFPSMLVSLTLLYNRLEKLTPAHSNQGSVKVYEFSNQGKYYYVSCRWQMGKPTRIGIIDPTGRHKENEVAFAIIDHDPTGRVLKVHMDEDFPSIFGSLNVLHESYIHRLWRKVAKGRNTREIKSFLSGVC